MAKKKVTYVITKSNWGGAQRYVFDLATHLPKDQFEVSVALGGTGLAGAQPGALDVKLRDAGVRTIYIESFVRDVSAGSDIKSFFELYRLFKKEKPDVVHLNSSKAGGVGALAARMAGVKNIIFTAHGWPFWEKRNPLVRGLIYAASWLTALLCTKIIVISDYDLRVAKKMPFISKKVMQIYNGVDLSPRLDSGQKIRSAFPAGVKITGTIGELNKNKNQISLIEQAKQNPDIYVAIVGDGELRGYLENKIKEYKLESRVKLFGFIPQNEVLKGFDVFALPSLKEGLPYVLLEARAANLPIEANRVGGVGEILDAKDMSEFSLERMVEKTIALY
jgi:glycosyltransferase involved in cell wall biosynthesis